MDHDPNPDASCRAWVAAHDAASTVQVYAVPAAHCIGPTILLPVNMPGTPLTHEAPPLYCRITDVNGRWVRIVRFVTEDVRHGNLVRLGAQRVRQIVYMDRHIVAGLPLQEVRTPPRAPTLAPTPTPTRAPVSYSAFEPAAPAPAGVVTPTLTPWAEVMWPYHVWDRCEDEARTNRPLSRDLYEECLGRGFLSVLELCLTKRHARALAAWPGLTEDLHRHYGRRSDDSTLLSAALFFMAVLPLCPDVVEPRTASVTHCLLGRATDPRHLVFWESPSPRIRDLAACVAEGLVGRLPVGDRPREVLALVLEAARHHAQRFETRAPGWLRGWTATLAALAPTLDQVPAGPVGGAPVGFVPPPGLALALGWIPGLPQPLGTVVSRVAVWAYTQAYCDLAQWCLLRSPTLSVAGPTADPLRLALAQVLAQDASEASPHESLMDVARLGRTRPVLATWIRLEQDRVRREAEAAAQAGQTEGGWKGPGHNNTLRRLRHATIRARLVSLEDTLYGANAKVPPCMQSVLQHARTHRHLRDSDRLTLAGWLAAIQPLNAPPLDTPAHLARMVFGPTGTEAQRLELTGIIHGQRDRRALKKDQASWGCLAIIRDTRADPTNTGNHFIRCPYALHMPDASSTTCTRACSGGRDDVLHPLDHVLRKIEDLSW